MPNSGEDKTDQPLTIGDMLSDLECIANMDSDLFGKIYTPSTSSVPTLRSLTQSYNDNVPEETPRPVTPYKEFERASQSQISSALAKEKKEGDIHLQEIYQKTYESSRMYVWLVDWINSASSILNTLPEHINSLRTSLQNTISLIEKNETLHGNL